MAVTCIVLVVVLPWIYLTVNELKSPVIDGPDGKPKVEYSFSEAYNKILQVFNVDAKPMTQSEHKQPEN